MVNYDYSNSARLIFGKGQEKNIATYIQQYGGKKVLIHYGQNSVKKTGLLRAVEGYLSEAGLEYIEFGGVLPNPRLSLAKEGARLCVEENVDFILAIGGGSVIDSAKAMAAQAKVEDDFWDYLMGGKPVPDALPIGVILTIPASGSEGSGGLVITNDLLTMKRSYNCPCLTPKFAVQNPELQYSLPQYQTACGCFDIVSHLMERYFTTVDHTEVTDRLLESCASVVVRNSEIVLSDPTNYDARAEITQAGTWAHNGLLDCGRISDWATHTMEHELSGLTDITHGAGLSILTPAWMKYVYKKHPNRFVQFGVRVFHVDNSYDSIEEMALATIMKIEKWAKSMGLPVRFSEVDFDEADIPKLADMCFIGVDGTIGSFVPLEKKDVEAIFRLAL